MLLTCVLQMERGEKQALGFTLYEWTIFLRQTKIYCLRAAQECVSINASCWI